MGGSIKTGGSRCVISGMMILCISWHARAQGGSALGGQQGEGFVIAIGLVVVGSGQCQDPEELKLQYSVEFKSIFC